MIRQKLAIYFAVWLFLGSLFPQTDLGQLSKVPILLLHYHIEHAGISMLDFIDLHYGKKAASHGTHEDLPMHKHTATALGYVFIRLEINNSIQMPNMGVLSLPITTFWQNLYRSEIQCILFSPPENNYI